MADELNVSPKERDVLIKCIAEAHEALRLLPDVEGNGPALVWLASHFLEVHRHNEMHVAA
jgi:hypothetical protein